MNLLLLFAVVLQLAGTPIAGGSVVISPAQPLYPNLPAGTKPLPINEDWELLYYRVTPLGDGYLIDGEIRNISDNPLTTAELIVSTADGIEFGLHPDVDIVSAGGRAPFHEDANDDVIASLNRSTELSFVGICDFYRVASNQRMEWEFENVEVEWELDRQAILVTGSVTYVGESKAEGLAPTIFGFTSDGHYIGSRNDTDGPRTYFGGDSYEFAIDQGFDSFLSSEPFAAADRENLFVLAMSTWVGAYGSCVAN